MLTDVSQKNPLLRKIAESMFEYESMVYAVQISECYGEACDNMESKDLYPMWGTWDKEHQFKFYKRYRTHSTKRV